MAEWDRQWHCTVNGQKYGPVSETELREWVAQGRVRPSDMVWTESMPNWQPLESVQFMFRGGLSMPPPTPGAGPVAAGASQVPLKAHRGGTILALGLVGLLACWIVGIFGWSMGNQDLAEMQAGMMDRTGEGMTQAGRICGMIATILGILGSCGAVVWMIVMFGLMGANL